MAAFIGIIVGLLWFRARLNQIAEEEEAEQRAKARSRRERYYNSNWNDYR